MRQASLKIVRQENSSSVFWSIYVPAYLNPTGKAGKMYFSTRSEAEAKRWELLAATRTESKLTELRNAQIRDAQRAIERLAEAGLELSLDRAIELALPTLKASGRNITTDQLFQDFAAAKVNDWSAASKRAFATSSKTFLQHFGGRLISTIDPNELETWYNATFATSGYRAHELRSLRIRRILGKRALPPRSLPARIAHQALHLPLASHHAQVYSINHAAPAQRETLPGSKFVLD